MLGSKTSWHKLLKCHVIELAVKIGEVDLQFALSSTIMYIILWKFFNMLSAQSTRSCWSVALQPGNHHQLYDLLTTIFDHLDDGGTLCTEAHPIDSVLHVASRIQLSVAGQQTRAHSKVRIRAMSSLSGFYCQLKHMRKLALLLTIHFFNFIHIKSYLLSPVKPPPLIPSVCEQWVGQ